MPCLYCDSINITYKCDKCSKSFCEKHYVTTESFNCKKHSVSYLPEKAKIFDYKCTIIPKSRCPQCTSQLMMDKLAGGQYFLTCTKCSWNSYSGNPSMHYITPKALLLQAVSSKLIRKAELCNIKLRNIKGVEICPNCFTQFLINGGITSFSTIKNTFNLEPETAVRIINKLKADKRIFGQIDNKNLVFINIPENSKDFINKELEKEGKLSIESLANRFKIPEENALELIYEMLKEYQIHGTFDLDKKIYYTIDFLNNWLVKTANERGRIRNKEIGKLLGISHDIIKHYIMELLKSTDQKLNAYFADAGSEVVTKEKLKNEIAAYCKQKGFFKLSEAANNFKVALELVRRTLFVLIEEKKIRGIFTQKREFVTEEKLSEQIKEITKIYRPIKLRDLARKLGITELRVEEILANLISRGAIYGYINMNKHEFEADIRQPTTIGPATIPTDSGTQKDNVEVVREYDFVGGQLHFKVIVRNNSNMAIHDIKVILDVPTSYKRQSEFLNVSVIDPFNTRGIDFYLEPVECGISTVAGTVIYKDAMGKPHTIHIRPKDVQIKCPLVVKTLDTIDDIQIAIKNLPSDARAFLIADLDPQLAYRAAFRAITNFDTRNVTSLEIPESNRYEAEAWFSSEAKVGGGRIVTRIHVEGVNNALEIRVWCNDPGQLTGFLAKIVEILFLEINLVRKVKAEERQKTVDAMSITQNLITASDYCAVRYKGKEILLKLEDTHARMGRMVGEDDPTLSKIEYWIEKLANYSEDSPINDEDAEILMSDIEGFQNVLARTLASV